MDFNHLLLGGAALGLIAGAWGHIKAVFLWLIGLFIRRIEIESEEGHQAVIAYLITRYRTSRNYNSMYGADYEHRRDGLGNLPKTAGGNQVQE